jgi:flagellar biosynthetic protein FlhB
LSFDGVASRSPTAMNERLGNLVYSALLTFSPVFGLLCVAALGAPLMLGGLMFNPGLIGVRLERLDPMAGLARMFSGNGLIELIKATLTVALLGSVAYMLLKLRAASVADLVGMPLLAALSSSGHLIFSTVGGLVLAVALAASVDAPLQWFRHRKQLRMTHAEAKRENKDMEGDPQIKARVKGAMRQMARKRMMAAVPKADVVVTNPDHFAVALKYLEQRHAAPVVVAKGMDLVAENIKELARANGVPRLEAPPLARALYRHVEINDPIPAPLYQAVAQVLAYVHQLRSYATGTGPRPVEPHDIAVPDGMDPLQPRSVA